MEVKTKAPGPHFVLILQPLWVSYLKAFLSVASHSLLTTQVGVSSAKHNILLNSLLALWPNRILLSVLIEAEIVLAYLFTAFVKHGTLVDRLLVSGSLLAHIWSGQNEMVMLGGKRHAWIHSIRETWQVPCVCSPLCSAWVQPSCFFQTDIHSYHLIKMTVSATEEIKSSKSDI